MQDALLPVHIVLSIIILECLSQVAVTVAILETNQPIASLNVLDTPAVTMNNNNKL